MSVLFSHGCCNKVSLSQWLKMAEMCVLSVLRLEIQSQGVAPGCPGQAAHCPLLLQGLQSLDVGPHRYYLICQDPISREYHILRFPRT